MIDLKRIERNEERWGECDPGFADRGRLVYGDLERAGWRPRTNTAWRSIEDQAKEAAEGDSTVAFGFHNATGPDGEKQAMAVDVIDDDKPSDAARGFLMALAIFAADHGLCTGITFGLDAAGKAAMATAIKQRDFSATGLKFGWDAGHLQPAGMRTRDAHDGMRMSRLEGAPLDPPKRQLLIWMVCEHGREGERCCIDCFHQAVDLRAADLISPANS